MGNFKSSNPFSFSDNLLNRINKKWFLITSGDLSNYNMMTASWGMFGILWNKPVAQVFIRPSRYTFEYVNKNDFFSICFFEDSYKDILQLLGSKSGRDFNKMHIDRLSPINYQDKTIFFKEASEILILKKLLVIPLDSSRITTDVKEDFYKENDFHFIFLAQIVDYLTKNY
ncbi:MAG: flavin reductase [Exilispira sp.]